MKLLGITEITALLGVSRATVYRMIQSNDFVKPVRLSPNRVAWPEAEVREWLSQKLAERVGAR